MKEVGKQMVTSSSEDHSDKLKELCYFENMKVALSKISECQLG